MKTSRYLVIILIGAILVWLFLRLGGKSQPTVSMDNIAGCYVMTFEKDVYTLMLNEPDQGHITGTLDFNNYQKDSSSGTFIGEFIGDVLVGTYTFQSEGMNSVMEVAFKKMEDRFVRGYGPLTDDGTRFADLGSLTFRESDPLAVFVTSPCE